VGVAAAWFLSRVWHLQPPGLDLLIVIVALMAARFGYVVGVVTGAAAGLLSLSAVGQSPAAYLSAFTDRTYLAAAFSYPILGVLVGLVGDLPRTQMQRAKDELARVSENYQQLTERFRVLLEAKEAVDRRIVGQVQTIASLYEAARELETLVPQQIPPAILRLLVRFLEVEAAALYTIAGDRLILVDAVGVKARRPIELGLDSVLGSVATLRQSLSVTHQAEREEAGCLLAAPLLHVDGRGRGVIAIEQLPFRQLTPATAQMLGLLADWASRALANSEAFTRSQELQRDHPVTGLRRVHYMDERLHNEWASARRYKLPLSVIMINDPALEHADEDTWNAKAGVLAAELKKRVRNIDVGGHYRTRSSFLMILPVTPLEGAKILAGRLAEALPGSGVAAGSNEEGAPDVEAMLQSLQAQVFMPEVSHAG
jgi:GAF domain-containing protein